MRGICLLLLALSQVPLAPWLGARLLDGSEEGCFLLLIPLALTLRRVPAAFDLRCCGLFLGLEAGLAPWLPLLARALLAALALGSLLASWRGGGRLGVMGLCLLSVPGLASGQFLLGYPLRRLVSYGSAGLLKLSGYAVTVEGVALRYQDQLVLVDAPCSGIKMAWAGLALVLVLALRRHWSAAVTWRWLLLAGGLTVAANCWRGAALFVLSQYPLPAWTHEATGLLIFALSAGLLVSLSPPEQSPPTTTHGPTRGFGWFVLAAALNLIPWSARESAPPLQSVQWPQQWEGRRLQPLPQSPEEQRYYANFPGQMARFSDGRREIILRYLTSPTRRLHPSTDCFRGLGYQVEEEGLWRDPQGQLWHRFQATRGEQRMRVRERIYNAQRSWTDLSEWYWTAGQGPWWSVCVAEAE